MGSTQSSSIPPVVPSDNNNNSKVEEKPSQIQKSKKKAPPPKNLTGYALVEYKCRKKRARYDQCYRQTHSAFVVGKKLFDKDGDEIDHKTSCEDLFEAYKDCMYRGMMKDRKERGLGAAKSESALGDYFNEEEE